MKRIGEFFRGLAIRLWRSLSRNLGWKIVSVVCALLLWSYIISVDTSITHIKTLAGVDVTTSGLTVLQSRGLALLTDPDTFTDIHVRVEASQSNFSRVTNDTVHVELDLSQIAKTGIQEVELTGVSAYGEVVQISPSSVEVIIENLDSRNVPVNVELTGDISKNYWYNVNRANPSLITVSGPSSIVQTVSSARAQIDVTGQTSSYSRAAQLTLLNDQGQEVSSFLLTKSSSSNTVSSISVSIDIYPTLQLAVDDSIDTATTGTLPEGYEITRVEVQPETITVAADQSLLDELEGLSIAPIDVAGRTSSFSSVSTINTLKDIRYISSEQVTITVYIEEIDAATRLDSVPLTVRGKSDRQKVTLSANALSVRASGAYSDVNAVKASDLLASVDVTNLTAGKYELPVTVSSDHYHDLTFEADPATVTVTIENAAP